MKTVNLTQHPTTPEQKEEGVFDLEGKMLSQLKAKLTFDTLEDAREHNVHTRAVRMAAVVRGMDPKPQQALLGGAPFLMGPLADELRKVGVAPVFAFSVRDSKEVTQADGSVRKVAVFRHLGLV